MMFVGYDTTEDDNRISLFIYVGLILTLVVLGLCVMIASFISKYVERQLKNSQKKLTEEMEKTKEREKELVETQSLMELQLLKLNLTVKSAKIGLWDMVVVPGDSVNVTNRFMWSDEFRQMLGYENEDDFPNILGSLINAMHPDYVEQTDQAFIAHVIDTTGKTPFDVEYLLRKKNGEYAYFHATGEAMRDEHGNAIRVAGALIDINEEKAYREKTVGSYCKNKKTVYNRSSVVSNTRHFCKYRIKY